MPGNRVACGQAWQAITRTGATCGKSAFAAWKYEADEASGSIWKVPPPCGKTETIARVISTYGSSSGLAPSGVATSHPATRLERSSALANCDESSTLTTTGPGRAPPPCTTAGSLSFGVSIR